MKVTYWNVICGFILKNKENSISNCFIACLLCFCCCAYCTTDVDMLSKALFLTMKSLLFFQILSVSAIVLANLCVSYIMTSQNEEVCIISSLLKKIKQFTTIKHYYILTTPHNYIVNWLSFFWRSIAWILNAVKGLWKIVPWAIICMICYDNSKVQLVLSCSFSLNPLQLSP